MPHPVYSHIFGTLALIAMMISVSLFAEGILYISYLQTQKARLSEVAESVARELVEIVSVHTLGEGGFTYMQLKIPQTIGGSAYIIKLEELDENRLLVKVCLQHNEIVKVVAVPNFGTGTIHVVNITVIDTSRQIEYGPELYVPCKKPIVFVLRKDNKYYIALGKSISGG